ncbi:MAG TPA: hypothetical protein DEV98_04275 [Clostridiales bacterium]|nr:hypothetical protein [Clostridiales bacterium]
MKWDPFQKGFHTRNPFATHDYTGRTHSVFDCVSRSAENGCCYGIPWKHGYVYHSTVGTTPIGMPLLPIQLIEAGTLLVLFAVQLFLFSHRHRTGRNTVFYFFAYPVVRFVLEFFRGDAERGKLLGLSTSQWGSVLIIGILMAVIIIRRHRSQNAKTPSAVD